MRTALLIVLTACQVATTDNFANPPAGPPASCTTIASLPGCDQGSLSYSCTTDRPDDGDSDLVCGDGIAGALGATLYCCAPFSQYYTDCAPDPTIEGCTGVAIGFACSGAVTPTDADPTIACSAATGDGEYCCTTAAPIVTCAADPSVACSGVAVGYSCAPGSAPPFASGFACTANGDSYCCAPS